MEFWFNLIERKKHEVKLTEENRKVCLCAEAAHTGHVGLWLLRDTCAFWSEAKVDIM